MAFTLHAPWWRVDCDDGCLDGRDGVVSAHVPLEVRVAVLVILNAISVGGALAIASRRMRKPTVSVLVGALAVVCTALMASLIVIAPEYENGAPIVAHRYGWALAIVLTTTTFLTSAGLIIAAAYRRCRSGQGRTRGFASG